ncbi:MAG TPA: hypothetical protein VMV29_21645 [Ktedonobacterales bacterium]|nr:hypothetical protein [Ktedonobacterales bacterium]
MAQELELAVSTAPVACTLSNDELADRSVEVHAMFAHVEATRELVDGYAFRFPGDAEWVARLAEFVAFERACCQFFTFELTFAPELGPVWLSLRGGEGVKEVAQSFMS